MLFDNKTIAYEQNKLMNRHKAQLDQTAKRPFISFLRNKKQTKPIESTPRKPSVIHLSSIIQSQTRNIILDSFKSTPEQQKLEQQPVEVFERKNTNFEIRYAMTSASQRKAMKKSSTNSHPFILSDIIEKNWQPKQCMSSYRNTTSKMQQNGQVKSHNYIMRKKQFKNFLKQSKNKNLQIKNQEQFSNFFYQKQENQISSYKGEDVSKKISDLRKNSFRRYKNKSLPQKPHNNRQINTQRIYSIILKSKKMGEKFQWADQSQSQFSIN